MTVEPLTVTAVLRSPPVVRAGPLMLDGILYGALGRRTGAAHPSGWADEADVRAEDLPLARVEVDGQWWHACSQVTPAGPEQTWHVHRKPPLMEAARWTDRKSINVGAGPDKQLRKRTYYRPGMMVLRWTCVGDRAGIEDLLWYLPGVGPLLAHGFGWVARWEVEPGGPPLDAYATDVRLRHLPASTAPPLPVGVPVTRRRLVLAPPYHRRGPEAVDCLQVPHERP